MVSDRHIEAANLIEAGQEDHAFGIVQDLLKRERDDAHALYLLGTMHAKAEQYTSAWLAFRRAWELKPGRPQIMNNIGMTLEGLGRSAEARDWFERASAKDPTNANYLCNIGMTYLMEGDVKAATTWATRALRHDAEYAPAHTCRAFAQLAQGMWAEGWDDYSYALGGRFRAKQDYGRPDWKGEPGARLIVCTEQGIGDEIMYSSILPEVIERCERVAIDCDARVVKLFRRTFGADKVVVHGTRAGEKIWLDDSWTHQVMIGELPKIFRRDAESFPGTPFLAVNDDLAHMYDALLDKHAGGKRRIGLMMSGGGYHTGRKRALGVDAFKDLVEQHAAYCEFFSLEYRNGSGEVIAASGLPIHHFHYAVGQGADFDHTAALISRLDMVVGIHTTAHHAAGALGVPTITLVPAQPSWQYGVGLGDTFPWYNSVRLFRQRGSESWAHCVRRMGNERAADLRGL